MRQADKPLQIPMGPQTFKDTLYGETGTGWLTLFYTPSRRTVWFPVTEPVPDLDLEQNCYLGIGIRRQRPDNDLARGRTEDIIAIPGLWLDLDYQSPGAHKVRHPLPPTEDAALSLLDAAPYKPSLIVHSGHGLQVYWLFKEIACFDSQADRDAYGRLCRGWQQLFQQAGRDRGWHVDSTADLARVLRIPGTHNLKTGEAREVVVREANDFCYDPSDFSDFAEPDVPSSPPGRPVSPSSNGHLDLCSLRVSPRIKYLIQHGDSIGQYPSRSEALFAVLMALFGAGYDDGDIARLCLMETYRISELPREKGPIWLQQELQRAHRKANDRRSTALGQRHRASVVMARKVTPTRPIIDSLLYEGLLLFGGKAKRGKSWLMLDLALSVATGNPVWGHFPTAEPQPVLYLALEDGELRTNHRLHHLQPGIEAIDPFGHLDLIFDFPMLSQGGVDMLRRYIENTHYRLVVIDTLAMIEPPGKGNGLKRYHEVYGMFAPLRELQRQRPFCLAMVTHLRKAEADDIFDTLHGSVAYQGVQDTLWVLERPPHKAVGVLHVRGREGDEQALHLSFAGGHWEFIGHDAEIQLSQARQDILDLFEEKERVLNIDEILKYLSRPRDRYQALRQTLCRMVRDDQLIRLGRGRYAATQGAKQKDL